MKHVRRFEDDVYNKDPRCGGVSSLPTDQELFAGFLATALQLWMSIPKPPGPIPENAGAIVVHSRCVHHRVVTISIPVKIVQLENNEIQARLSLEEQARIRQYIRATRAFLN
jgi:hypothetical protein